MVSPKQHSKFPPSEANKALDKEIKIPVLQKLTKVQANTERQLRKIKKTVHEHIKFRDKKKILFKEFEKTQDPKIQRME